MNPKLFRRATSWTGKRRDFSHSWFIIESIIAWNYRPETPYTITNHRTMTLVDANMGYDWVRRRGSFRTTCHGLFRIRCGGRKETRTWATTAGRLSIVKHRKSILTTIHADSLPYIIHVINRFVHCRRSWPTWTLLRVLNSILLSLLDIEEPHSVEQMRCLLQMQLLHTHFMPRSEDLVLLPENLWNEPICKVQWNMLEFRHMHRLFKYINDNCQVIYKWTQFIS